MDLVRELQDTGEISDVTVELLVAVADGCEKRVTRLLEMGVSVDAENPACTTSLHVAAAIGNADMVQLLLLNGAERDAVGPYAATPLAEAVFRGHLGATQVLLAAGADTSFHSSTCGFSALDLAVVYGKINIVRALIEHGVDVNAKNSQDITSLHAAAFRNQTQAMNVLIDAGANIEARVGSPYRTPLHAAAVQLSVEAAHVLLKRGAVVDVQDINGLTPLHHAARKAGTENAAKMAYLLLRWGADETVTTKSGQTPEMVMGLDLDDDEDPVLDDDFERVRELLLNAPADRAWRRRGIVVLCRAHPDRIQLTRQRGSSQPRCLGMASCTRSGVRRARLERAEKEASGGDVDSKSSRSCSKGIEVEGGTALSERNDGDWACVAGRLIRLAEEGVFRTIVGYL